jgi:D-alanyl-D-alanine carboxypeptidase
MRPRFRHRLIAVTGALALAATSLAATGSPAAATTVDPLDSARSLVAAGAPGAVAAISDSHGTRIAAAGLADIERGIAMRPRDRLRIGSVSKSFTAVTVLRLVARHRIALDAPVDRYLPGLVPGGRRMTIRHLLGMRSGLYGYKDDAFIEDLYSGSAGYRWTPAQLLSRAFRQPLLFRPGARGDYSNTNYVVLGLVVERVTGRPFSHALRTQVLRPLGLRDTALVNGTISGPHAHGYDRPGWPYTTVAGGAFGDVERLNGSQAWTAGAMVSSAPDLVRFFRAVLAGRLLPPHLMAEMRGLTPIPPGKFIDRYGLGLVVNPHSCGDSWGHDGAIEGYVADVMATPHGSKVALFLTNRELNIPSDTYVPAILDAEERLYCAATG